MAVARSGILHRRQRSQKIRAEEQGFREEEERRKGPRTDLQNKRNTGTSMLRAYNF
jgi:hypothetical protein